MGGFTPAGVAPMTPSKPSSDSQGITPDYLRDIKGITPDYSKPIEADKELVKHMVDRFLGWRLPKDFQPDAGISYRPPLIKGTPYVSVHRPVGTNLLTATQATEMVKYMLEAAPILALVDKACVAARIEAIASYKKVLKEEARLRSNGAKDES